MREGRNGFLGVGSRGVRIRVLPEGEPPTDVDSARAPGTEAERIEGFLGRFSAASPFEIEFRVVEDAEKIRIELNGNDRDLFLSRRGEGLNALQTILGRI